MLSNESATGSALSSSSSTTSTAAARSHTGSSRSASRSAAGTASGGSASHRAQPRSHHPMSSASSVSSVSSSSTTTTNRTNQHNISTYSDLQNGDNKRRAPSRTMSSGSSSTTKTQTRRRESDDVVGGGLAFQEDGHIGPEKFAAKVVGGIYTLEHSSSSSGPGSDKDELSSPQQPGRSVASSISSNSSSKPSRMIVKRRTLGNSRAATSVSSTSIPNKYVRQTSKEHAQEENLVVVVPSSSPPVSGGSAELMDQRARSGSQSRRADSVAADSTTTSQLQQVTTPRTLARKVPTRYDDPSDESKENGDAAAKPRPVRIKYEPPTRGLGGGKREISHASLGKLIARLTDAHQYDTQFRDVFLLTYRCFCSPYDFIKKLMKRYTAVLTLCSGLDTETLQETQLVLDQIVEEEENDRSSTSTSISTARSDINTGMEASVSIMRLLSVLKFWIKESGFIDMDLQGDRRSQKKLMAFLSEIQSTSPVVSIRKHAESMLLLVAQLVRNQQLQAQQQQLQQQQQKHAASLFNPLASTSSVAGAGMPPPPVLKASTSVSSISDSISGDKPRVIDERSTEGTLQPSRDRMITAAMSKLKLTRSSSDPKRERSMVKLKTKQGGNGDIFQLRSRGMPSHGTPDDALSQSKAAAAAGAPKIVRGITTGSADPEAFRSGLDESSFFHDSMHRSRITLPRNSSRTSYDNVEPLTGITAQELADQLTLVEAEQYFGKLSPRELTNKAWTRETKFKDAPHVMALIELFDATAEWVSSEILHPRLQAVERAKIIMLFIEAAENCYQMNNFNTLFEIFTGLSAPFIRQLNTTWGLVSAAATEKYQFLHGICSTEDNYRNYRQQFGFAEGQPRLPCWFILVKDLFQYEESMKSMEDGLVNWQKFRKIYRVINEALDHQNLNYLPPASSMPMGAGPTFPISATTTTTTAATGISRKGKGILRHDRKLQNHLRTRLETIRKDSSVLYQLSRNANTQESILFVNSLSEAGFL
uniref:Ras-GEF domain-containing protein n=1 Tax=Globisporangium ultimum (strain ATCC 200006 / CBS 805.95 / DAOM BR144) TaxID=431595 RepID=K3X1Z6_GLOUD